MDNNITTAKLTSTAQRNWLLKNKVAADAIPELARDAMRQMDLIIAKRKKQRAGAPTTPQVAYLVDQMNYKRADAIKFSFGEASTLIYKNKLARAA